MTMTISLVNLFSDYSIVLHMNTAVHHSYVPGLYYISIVQSVVLFFSIENAEYKLQAFIIQFSLKWYSGYTWRLYYMLKMRCDTSVKTTLHKNSLKTVHKPLKMVHKPLKMVHKPLKMVHKPLKMVHKPLKTVHKPLKMVHKPLKTVHKPLKMVHKPGT